MFHKIFFVIIIFIIDNIFCKSFSCDYYIYKKLLIHYKNNKDYSTIELSKKDGYYCFFCTDYPNYQSKFLE